MNEPISFFNSYFFLFFCRGSYVDSTVPWYNHSKYVLSCTCKMKKSSQEWGLSNTRNGSARVEYICLHNPNVSIAQVLPEPSSFQRTFYRLFFTGFLVVHLRLKTHQCMHRRMHRSVLTFFKWLRQTPENKKVLLSMQRSSM